MIVLTFLSDSRTLCRFTHEVPCRGTVLSYHGRLLANAKLIAAGMPQIILLLLQLALLYQKKCH